LRQAIASAVNSKSLQQKEAHCSIDIIHSMGIAAIDSPIGIAASRFIDGLQHKEHQNLIYHLSKTAGRQLKCDKKVLLKVCHQVIHEEAFSFCKTCHGTKEMLEAELKITCHVCEGTGLHRYSDIQRAHAIGLSIELYVKYWARIYQIVYSVYTGESRNALNTTKLRLIA
jgi:hypothetical protein